MVVMFLSLLPYKFCQPFIGVALYQDLFYTMVLPIWVIIHSQMKASGYERAAEAILSVDKLQYRNHFFRTRHNIFNEMSPAVDVDFRKEDEEPMIADEAIVEREERLDYKLSQLTRNLESDPKKPLELTKSKTIFKKNPRLAVIKQ